MVKKYVFVKWYQFPREENTWEPIGDGNIPAPLLARFLKSTKARNVTQLLGSPPYFDEEGKSDTID